MQTLPVLSIAVPTFNRCELLEYCLDRHLGPFAGFGFPYEIVVSDNASTDATPEMVLGKIRQGHPIRFFRRRSTDAAFNYVNVFRKCRGSLVTYLADDDTILADPLSTYVERMRRDEECAGIYTDWVAYDDERGAEIHRYFPPDAAGRFTWQDRNAFVEHILANRLMPEIGVWRRSAFVRACTATKLQYPYVLWAYGVLRSGAVEFCAQPFYRENRVVASRFTRPTTTNSTWALGMIGDAMRLALENLVCMLMLDANAQSLPPGSLDAVRRSIDGWLHSRVDLEIARAIHRGDWITAVELRRRLALWHGAAPLDCHEHDLRAVTIPAALQRLHEIRLATSDSPELFFVGDALAPYAQLYRDQYPGSPAQAVKTIRDVDPATCLIACLPAELPTGNSFDEFPGHVVDLLALINDSRVGLVPHSLTPATAGASPR